VVLLAERKRDFVSDISIEVRRVVNELAVWANDDVVVVPSESQRQGEEESENSLDHHRNVVAGGR